MRSVLQLRDESGQVLLLAAMTMIVVVAILGIAVDVGYLRYEKRRLQTAADAAAMAGALEVRVCGGTANCGVMQAAAKNALVENGITGATLLTNCAGSSGAGVTLTLNNPVCAQPSDPHSGRLNYVEAVVTEQAPMFFARALNLNSLKLTARAQAARGLGGPCIYATNPSASGALAFAIGVGFQSKCGVVVESTSSSALTCLVGLLLYAPQIRVTGGTAGLLCGSQPPPDTGVPPPSPRDPLAYLPVPPTAGDACGTSSGNTYNGSPTPVNLTLPLLANITFNPGVYCGGITITASLLSTVTFNPGVYILRNGHTTGLLGLKGPEQSGLTITASLLSNITGSEVMFYNEGNAGSFSLTATAPVGLSNFNLSAPTTGEYGGVLFFQAHGIQNTGTFLASLVQGSSMNGFIYMPDALVTYGVGVISSAQHYNGIVADRVQFTANVLSTFANDYSTLQSGTPLNSDYSVMVQ